MAFEYVCFKYLFKSDSDMSWHHLVSFLQELRPLYQYLTLTLRQELKNLLDYSWERLQMFLWVKPYVYREDEFNKNRLGLENCLVSFIASLRMVAAGVWMRVLHGTTISASRKQSVYCDRKKFRIILSGFLTDILYLRECQLRWEYLEPTFGQLNQYWDI